MQFFTHKNMIVCSSNQINEPCQSSGNYRYLENSSGIHAEGENRTSVGTFVLSSVYINGPWHMTARLTPNCVSNIWNTNILILWMYNHIVEWDIVATCRIYFNTRSESLPGAGVDDMRTSSSLIPLSHTNPLTSKLSSACEFENSNASYTE